MRCDAYFDHYYVEVLNVQFGLNLLHELIRLFFNQSLLFYHPLTLQVDLDSFLDS